MTEKRDSAPLRSDTVTLGEAEGSAAAADHRARMAADPRFALWADADDQADRERRAAERRELMRIAAQQVIDEEASGRNPDPHRLAWARQIVATHKPLGRPLSDGAPRAPAPAFPHASSEEGSE